MVVDYCWQLQDGSILFDLMGSKQSVSIETPPFKAEEWEYLP